MDCEPSGTLPPEDGGGAHRSVPGAHALLIVLNASMPCAVETGLSADTQDLLTANSLREKANLVAAQIEDKVLGKERGRAQSVKVGVYFQPLKPVRS